MKKLTTNGRINALEARMATVDAKLDQIIAAMAAMTAQQTATPAEAPKVKNSTAKKSNVVDIKDYAPTEWGNRAGKGYTALRKAYSYAKCGGKDNYDEAIYKAASEEFEKKYKDALKAASNK